jgi:hypothetical protein
MKKHIIAAFVLSFGITPMLNAQVSNKKATPTTQKNVEHLEVKSAEDRAQAYTDHMKKELNLSQMQEQKIYELSLGVEWKNEAIRSNEEYSPEKKQQFIQANLDQKKMMMNQMLDEQQISKLETLENKTTTAPQNSKKTDEHAPRDAEKEKLQK